MFTLREATAGEGEGEGQEIHDRLSREYNNISLLCRIHFVANVDFARIKEFDAESPKWPKR